MWAVRRSDPALAPGCPVCRQDERAAAVLPALVCEQCEPVAVGGEDDAATTSAAPRVPEQTVPGVVRPVVRSS